MTLRPTALGADVRELQPRQRREPGPQPRGEVPYPRVDPVHTDRERVVDARACTDERTLPLVTIC